MLIEFSVIRLQRSCIDSFRMTFFNIDFHFNDDYIMKKCVSQEFWLKNTWFELISDDFLIKKVWLYHKSWMKTKIYWKFNRKMLGNKIKLKSLHVVKIFPMFVNQSELLPIFFNFTTSNFRNSLFLSFGSLKFFDFY